MRALRFLLRLTLGLLALAVVGGAGAAFLVYHSFGRDLPDIHQLATYSPPTVTRVHAADGRLLAEYARERRIFVPVAAIPDRVKQAFISAEDQHFYEHPGVDVLGILRASFSNLERLESNRRPAGASTITQQVAKNFLLSNELSIGRKIKEAILALRIEQAFSKDQILELYLNEIFLGARSYGVAAAALNYFDKSLDDLSIAEAAFLGGLPKAPSSYDPRRNPQAAKDRRDYVIGRMQEDGYITAAQADGARAEPITVRDASEGDVAEAPFFVEEVRRQLVDRYGEAGFYEGGLSVRTTVEPSMQALADRALRHGLASYDRKSGPYRGPWGQLPDKALAGGWEAALKAKDPGFELQDWHRGVVLEASPKAVMVGFDDGSRQALAPEDIAWAKRGGKTFARGDLVLVELQPDKSGAKRPVLRQRTKIEGAVVAMDPHTGRVLALSGGFSFRESKFNRATQARRQPGSSFKPFVYLTALENGYTPASIILDAPIEIDQGPGLPPWRPENYTERYYGPSTLRLGLEQSRNVMTVRLAQAIGMPKIIDMANRFGIGEGLGPYLSAALGSNEVTVLNLTTAYAMLVNGGKRITPALVERIQDRRGGTLMRRDERPCEGCQSVAWSPAMTPPAVPDTREQVEDPRYAYQMVMMLRGVVERGTAAAASQLGRTLAGKTGTTNDAKDTWFMGFSPDLVVGVWMGYDQPESLGNHETGAVVALPVWMEVMRGALEGKPDIPFRTPPGVEMVRIDAKTGTLPGPDTKTVIAEAFIPGTEPFRQGEGQPAEPGPEMAGAAAGAAFPLPPPPAGPAGGIY